GVFYGTTSDGGTNNRGTLFKITSDGTFTPLTAFDGTNGASPRAKLLSGSDGYLYGTTYMGGSSNIGTVFRSDTNGNLQTLISFDTSNGALPTGGLIAGQDGFLYGTTEEGFFYDTNSNQAIIFGAGTVFRMTTDGELTTLYSLGGESGYAPLGNLVQGSDGALYGATYTGG